MGEASEWYAVFDGEDTHAHATYESAVRAIHGRALTLAGPFPTEASAREAREHTVHADMRAAWQAWERASTVRSRT
jgi:hypothetical protein